MPREDCMAGSWYDQAIYFSRGSNFNLASQTDLADAAARLVNIHSGWQTKSNSSHMLIIDVAGELSRSVITC